MIHFPPTAVFLVLAMARQHEKSICVSSIYRLPAFRQNSYSTTQKTLSREGILETLVSREAEEYCKYLVPSTYLCLAYTFFQLDSLQEVNKDGSIVGQTGRRKHAVGSLANQIFNYTDPNSQASYQGISASNINMTTELTGPQARLDISVYLFKENGSIEFGNETFEVRYWTFKFNIKVSVYCRKLTCISSGD